MTESVRIKVPKENESFMLSLSLFFFGPEGTCVQAERRFPTRLFFLSPYWEEDIYIYKKKKAGRSKGKGAEMRIHSTCHFAIPFSEAWLGA